MLATIANPTLIPPDEIESFAATAVWEVRERHAAIPGTARDRELAAEAAFLAACHLEDAARERLDAGGVAAAIYPAGFWEQVATPFVAAILASAPPSPGVADDALPAPTVDGLRAALVANGGVLEGGDDILLTIRRHTARLAREG